MTWFSDVLRKWGKPSTIPAGLQMLFEPFTASSLSSVAVTPSQLSNQSSSFSCKCVGNPHAVSFLLLLTQNPACLSSWPDHGLQTRTLTNPDSKRWSAFKSILQFHAVSSFQNPMNDLMIFVKTWRIQIHQDKLIRTPQDFSSEKSSAASAFNTPVSSVSTGVGEGGANSFNNSSKRKNSRKIQLWTRIQRSPTSAFY